MGKFMNKKISVLLVISFLAISATNHAQRRAIRTGVMPFYDTETKNTKSSNAKLILSELTESLSHYDFINIIERANLQELIREIELGQSGLIDDATAVKVGKVHGLQIMIVGTIHQDRITSRAIHMETQKVISTASVVGLSDIKRLGEKIASGIEAFLAKENLKRLRNDSPDIDLQFWVTGISKGKGSDITPDKSGRIKIGEKVIFKFKSSQSGYLTIVDIQPGGDVVILFPNDAHPSNKIESGRLYSIPSENDTFEITVSEPVGTDTIVAYFTRKRVDWLDRKKLTGEGFWTVKQNEKLATARGFAVTATTLKRTEWESVIIEIAVEK
jgi:hypothetical protein